MKKVKKVSHLILTFSLVIELLKGEKDLNTIATENNIQPNLLRNWKKEFLDKTSVVFDDTREDNLKEKLALERKEKAENAKKSRPAIRRIKVWEMLKYQKVSTSIKDTELVIVVIMNQIIVYGGKPLI